VLLSNICSLTPVAPNFEPCPATVAYLVSCGASPATAAARKIRIRDDTDRADAVGELLREYGFSEAEVTRTIVNGGPDAPHLRSRTEPPPRARIPPPHASAARLPPPFFFSRVVLRASAQSASPVNDAGHNGARSRRTCHGRVQGSNSAPPTGPSSPESSFALPAPSLKSYQ
jgi:hypothetical protein